MPGDEKPLTELAKGSGIRPTPENEKPNTEVSGVGGVPGKSIGSWPWVAILVFAVIVCIVASVYGVVPVALLGACVAALAVLWKLPLRVAARYPDLDAKARFEVENESRKTIAQIIGGAGLIATLYFTGLTFDLSRDRQLTERFEKANQQLGAVNKNDEPIRAVRIGAIYSLERIAQESERDHWPIMEQLSAYVRDRAPWPPKELPKNGHDCSELKPEADVQAALTVIGHRSDQRVKSDMLALHRVDLHGANLMGVDLRNAHLELANLYQAHLHCADVSGAKFKKAEMVAADMTVHNASDADFEGATFGETDFRGVNLRYAKLPIENLVLIRCSEATQLPDGQKCPPSAETGGMLGEFCRQNPEACAPNQDDGSTDAKHQGKAPAASTKK
jgi:hypothetical protein